MIGNLTGKQILMIIVGVIVLLWLIQWLTSPKRRVVQTQTIKSPQQVPSPQQVQQLQSPQPRQPVTTTVGLETAQPDTPFVLYNFYSPNCGHCKNFTPAWNEVADKLKGITGISVRAIDASKPENENLAFYYNITGYPTVILVTPDKNIEYSGDRSANDLHQFVVTNINQYAQNY